MRTISVDRVLDPRSNRNGNQEIYWTVIELHSLMTKPFQATESALSTVESLLSD
jgi:hypothetical protein